MPAPSTSQYSTPSSTTQPLQRHNGSPSSISSPTAPTTTTCVNNNKKNTSRLNHSRSKYFIVCFLSLILFVIIFVIRSEVLSLHYSLSTSLGIADASTSPTTSNNNAASYAMTLPKTVQAIQSSITSTSAATKESDPETPETDTTSSSAPRKIQQISLLGERNSGTRWTYSHLIDCFNDSIPVHRHLTRYKHWFQHDDPSEYLHDTLVITQYRNPIDWLKAMQKVPHHSPSHLDVNWKQFLTKPWTTKRYGLDLEIIKNITANGTTTANLTRSDYDHIYCQQKFHYQDIVSCLEHPLSREEYMEVNNIQKLRYSEETPFYEMRNDASGLPYDNIIDLRSDKILNFNSLSEREGIADVWIVQYEYLLQRGTQHFIDMISDYIGIPHNCSKIYEPQLRRSRDIELDFVKYVVNHIDWEIEKEIGYTIPKQYLNLYDHEKNTLKKNNNNEKINNENNSFFYNENDTANDVDTKSDETINKDIRTLNKDNDAIKTTTTSTIDSKVDFKL